MSACNGNSVCRGSIPQHPIPNNLKRISWRFGKSLSVWTKISRKIIWPCI